ncbi:MAG: LamG-like jellyroll fold domain-containing protein, partial [Bacteroidota bacterium]
MKKTFTFLLLSLLFNFSFAQNFGLEFDGADNKLNLCSSAGFNIGETFTVEAWVLAYNWKPEAWQGSIVTKDMQGPDSGFAFRAGKNGTLSFVMSSDQNWKEAQTSPTMNANQWYHVAAVVVDQTINLYINGVLEASQGFTGTPSDNIVPLTIGASAGFPDRGWDGIIDEIRIWETARTEAEINGFMTSQFTGSEPGLVAYLPMNEGEGTNTENLGGCNGNFSGGMTDAAWTDGFFIPTKDVGIAKMLSPDVWSIFERPVKVSFEVKNFVSDPVADFPIQLLVNGEVIKEETFSGTLEAGESQFYVFENPVDFNFYSEKVVTVRTGYVDDNNALNDGVTTNYQEPTDGTTITIFDGELHNFGVAGQTQFREINLPMHMEDYEKILLHFWVDCPSTGCDPWDQPASFFIDTPDGTFEIARYITPYGKGCGPWTVDVTDFKTVMRGPITFRSFVQVWGNSGWLVNAELEFIKTDTPQYQKLNRLWESYYWVYGDPGVSYDFPEDTVDISSVTESSYMRMTLTGHGQGNTDNAAEFSNKTHQIMIDGNMAGTHNPWKDDCAQNTCSDQFGTWLFSRAGWCPGQHVEPFIFDLNSYATPGAPMYLDYVLEEYTNLLNT